MKCAIYTRVSTDNQAEKDYNSCEAQEEKIRAFARSQDDLKLYKVYSDPGFSGASLDRPALNELLNDIVEGRVDCVLTYKIDRLTRSPKDFYVLIELFDRHGVPFISVTENFDTSPPSGRLLRNIMLTFAQFEREMTAERTRDKMTQRAEKGMWNGGIVPYGYKNVDKKLVVNEGEVKAVREIFRTFIKTKSLAETRRQINSKYRTRSDKKFGKGSIDNILRNPVYYGKITYKGSLYDGIHKSIITEAMFLKVQSLRKERIKPESKIKHSYLLAGLLRCGECGCIMTPTYTQNRQRGGEGSRFTYYYRCTRTYKHDWGSCSIKSVNADKIEKFVTNRLKEVSQDERAIESLVRKVNQEEEGRLSPLRQQESQLIEEIEEVDGKIRNLVGLLAAHSGGGKGSSERFPSILRGLENLENRKKVLEFDLEGMKLSIQREEQVKFEAKIVLDNLREFSRLIDEVEPSEKPHLFQYLIKSISYGRDEVGIDLFYFPQGHLSTWGTHRACPETRAAEDGEIAEGRRSSLEQGRRTLARRPSGGQMGEAGEHLVGSKNRSEWLFRTHSRYPSVFLAQGKGEEKSNDF